MGILKLLAKAMLAAATLTAVSCWSPLFDQNISLAALASAKMSLDAQFDASLNGSSSTNVVYFAVPSRERTPTNVAVFTLSAMSYGMTVYSNSGGNWASTGNNSGTSYDSPLSDPELVSIQAGGPGSLYPLAVFFPTLSSGTVQIVDTSSSSKLTSITPSVPTQIFGLTSFPKQSESDVNFIGSTGSSNQNYLTTASSSYATASTSGLNFTASESYGWYAYDETNDIGYLTHYSQDSSGNYKSEGLTSGTGVVASWNRKDHVVAFLTTGKLLTREGGYYDVCDGQGNIQYSFPAGSLKFAGEYYDSNQVARCSFTQVIPLGGGKSNSQQRIRVYSIATSNLSSLK